MKTIPQEFDTAVRSTRRLATTRNYQPTEIYKQIKALENLRSRAYMKGERGVDNLIAKAIRNYHEALNMIGDPGHYRASDAGRPMNNAATSMEMALQTYASADRVVSEQEQAHMSYHSAAHPDDIATKLSDRVGRTVIPISKFDVPNTHNRIGFSTANPRSAQYGTGWELWIAFLDEPDNIYVIGRENHPFNSHDDAHDFVYQNHRTLRFHEDPIAFARELMGGYGVPNTNPRPSHYAYRRRVSPSAPYRSYKSTGNMNPSGFRYKSAHKKRKNPFINGLMNALMRSKAVKSPYDGDEREGYNPREVELVAEAYRDHLERVNKHAESAYSKMEHYRDKNEPFDNDDLARDVNAAHNAYVALQMEAGFDKAEHEEVFNIFKEYERKVEVNNWDKPPNIDEDVELDFVLNWMNESDVDSEYADEVVEGEYIVYDLLPRDSQDDYDRAMYGMGDLVEASEEALDFVDGDEHYAILDDEIGMVGDYGYGSYMDEEEKSVAAPVLPQSNIGYPEPNFYRARTFNSHAMRTIKVATQHVTMEMLFEAARAAYTYFAVEAVLYDFERAINLIQDYIDVKKGIVAQPQLFATMDGYRDYYNQVEYAEGFLKEIDVLRIQRAPYLPDQLVRDLCYFFEIEVNNSRGNISNIKSHAYKISVRLPSAGISDIIRFVVNGFDLLLSAASAGVQFITRASQRVDIGKIIGYVDKMIQGLDLIMQVVDIFNQNRNDIDDFLDEHGVDTTDKIIEGKDLPSRRDLMKFKQFLERAKQGGLPALSPEQLTLAKRVFDLDQYEAIEAYKNNPQLFLGSLAFAQMDVNKETNLTDVDLRRTRIPTADEIANFGDAEVMALYDAINDYMRRKYPEQYGNPTKRYIQRLAVPTRR